MLRRGPRTVTKLSRAVSRLHRGDCSARQVQPEHLLAEDESLEDSSKLPDPHVLAAEIAEDLRSALEQIESVLGDLQQRVGASSSRTPKT